MYIHIAAYQRIEEDRMVHSVECLFDIQCSKPSLLAPFIRLLHEHPQNVHNVIATSASPEAKLLIREMLLEKITHPNVNDCAEWRWKSGASTLLRNEGFRYVLLE